jgi:group I intron endonuclease
MMLLTIPAGIYRIRNRVTGEVYIGSASNIYERIKAHCGVLDRGGHHNRLLQEAWNALGQAAFSFSILEVTPKDMTAMIEAENRWIDQARRLTPGLYNRRRAWPGCPVGYARERRRRASPPAARSAGEGE